MRRILFLTLCWPAWAIDVYHGGSWTLNAYPDTTTGWQSVLSALRNGTIVGGDIVQGTAGVLIDWGTTQVNLPAHQGTGVVTIRTSNFRNLPDGRTRVCPPHSSAATGRVSYPCTGNLADSGGTAGSSGGDLIIWQWDGNFIYAVVAAAGTRDYVFQGIEFRGTSRNPPVSNSYLLSLSPALATPNTSIHDRAQRITIDRCWFHGYFNSYGPTKGVNADGSGIRILNSVFEEIKQYSADSQGMVVWSGPGPIEVRNNFISAASEPTLTGGTLSRWPGSVPAFWTHLGNYATWDARWWLTTSSSNPSGGCTNGRNWYQSGSRHYWRCAAGAWSDLGTVKPADWPGDMYGTMKNTFEFKAMKRAVIAGNRFDNTWLSGQNYSVNLYTAAATQNGYRFSALDVDFHYNVVSNAAGGMQASSIQAGAPVQGLRIQHNLIDSILTAERMTLPTGAAGSGVSALIQSAYFEPYGLLFRHNTVTRSRKSTAWTLQGMTRSATTWAADAHECDYCQVYDNILEWNGDPITGGNTPPASTFFADPTVANHAWVYGTMFGNVIAKNGSTPITAHSTPFTSASACCNRGGVLVNYVADLTSDVLVNAGIDNHVLASGAGCGGSCRGKATDGADPGADMDTLTAMTAHAADGAANPYLDFRLGSVVCGTTSCSIYLQVPDAVQAPVIQASTSETMARPVSGAVVSRSGRAITATVAGLSAGTHYWYTVSFPALAGGSATRQGEFRTRLAAP